MERLLVILGWVLVAAAAAWLRFDGLGERPFHADEATGARITATRMETGGARFDPKHYHGPLLGDLAIPLCHARGEDSWRAMRKETLRFLPAGAGLLLVFVPLFWRRLLGDPAALVAGACLAASPLLVYYSRMFIHEMLLVGFGMLALAALTRGPRVLAAGVLIGLMFATKESFAISMIAWTCAAVAVAAMEPRWWRREVAVGFVSTWWKPALTASAVAAVTALLCYTGFLTHPRGALDAVRTFFVYETVDGHDKPLWWYLDLLLWPSKSGGMWWFETIPAVFALLAFGGTFVSGSALHARRHLVRFVAFGAAGHFAIYSLFAYKTPWLACLPWAHVCLLAGWAVAGVPERLHRFRLPAAAVIALVCAIPLGRQARAAAGRLSSDERNPYAYVPTRRDIERLESWLAQLRAVAAPGTADTAAVIGSDYWPLPWYLRSFEKTGYWRTPPDVLGNIAFVFAMPDAADVTGVLLADSHVPLPRGLRAEVPVILHVRKDVWDKWMEVGK